MPFGNNGFRGAPVSKGLLILITTVSLLVSLSAKPSRRRNSGLLRGITHAFGFQYIGEWFIAASLLYQFRVNERQMGPGKYAVFIMVCSCVGYGVQQLLFKFGGIPSAAGIYPIVFGNIVEYYLEIPSQSSFQVSGMTMSDKTFLYVAALKLAWSVSQKSLWAAVSGILGGVLYRCNILDCRNSRVPDSIESLFFSI
mmetsp:Transcript_7152/g.14304  ORF Transcript_7152/g.14304 Transcript_7152/m.14304 type:complete len:197 (-) Transcript_7152:73-663(-)